MTRVNLPLLAADISGAIAVAAGAYGHHGLDADDVAREAFMTGVQYQMWHALALLAAAWLSESSGSRRRWALGAATFFVLGTLLFSGTLYIFGATGDVPVAGAAPAGGIAFIAGWLLLAVAALWGGDNAKKQSSSVP